MAIDTTTSVDVQTLTPFKKFIMTIGNLPTSYLESMTYAELLMWFCNYLQETVIPTVNNNGDAVTELQGLYEQLQSYVNNYFDNLNVQTEINNKLDEMAEDGSLTNLIKAYIDPIQDAFENQINETVTAQTQQISTTQSDIAQLSSRMDTFTNLTDGSTSGDAELQDIRVDLFGHTYASAGASVRGQEEQNYDVTLGMLENIVEPITLTANDWQFGDVDSANGNVININTRIRTKNAIKVTKGSIIKLSTYTNRYFKVNFFKNETVGQSNWDNLGTTNLQNTYIVPKDGYICISILAPSNETIPDTETLSVLFTGMLYVLKEDVEKSFTMGNVPKSLVPLFCNNPVNFNTTTKILTFPSSCRAYHWKYGSSLNGAGEISLSNLTIDLTTPSVGVLWYDTINNELIKTNYYEIHKNNVMLNNSDYAMICAYRSDANTLSINAPYSINGYKYGIDASNITQLNVEEINHVAQFYADKTPSYWLQDPSNYTNYLEDKIKSVELKGLYNTAFITDTHYNDNNKHSFDLLGIIKDRLNMNDIVFGGDILGQENTKEIAKYKLIEHMSAATNRFGNGFKFVFGNHDLNVANLPDSATDTEIQAHALTYEQIYNYCVLPFDNDVHFEETDSTGEAYYRNKLHYYYDDEIHKIRNIILDSGTKHDLLGSGGTPGRLRFQFNWLADVLSNTPANYNVCVYVHEVYDGYENNAGTITGYGTWLSQILNGAKNKTTTSFTDYAGTTYSYDFTNINTIYIVGVFSGHIHIDYLTTVNTIPFIVTTKDAIGSVPSWGSVPMISGTTTEQAFDIISIDTTNRHCYLTRIGAGNDRDFAY